MRVIAIGIAIIVMPIILAFVSSVVNQNGMWDEGSGSGGYLWLLLFSVPIGLGILLVGITKSIIKMFKGK